MKTVRIAYKAVALAGLALALAVAAWAQSTPASTSPSNTPPASTSTAQSVPGTTPVGGDTTAAKSSATNPTAPNPKDKPVPGTTPVGGDTPAIAVNPDKCIDPGSQKVSVKPGSIDDVDAVGNRKIGDRGWSNWFSTDTEMKMGRTYATQIEKRSEERRVGKEDRARLRRY